MSDDEKPYVVALITDGGAFVPYAFSKTHTSACTRRKKLIAENKGRAGLRILKRIASGEYADVTPED